MSDLLHKPVSFPRYHNPVAVHPADEIDLFALCLTLWNHKRQIIAITLITILLAGAYASTATERWTVKAYLSTPRIAQMTDYLDLRRAFSRVSGTGADVQGLSHGLFNEFIAMAASPDEKMRYLSTTDEFAEQTRGMDEQTKRRWLNEMAEKKLTVTPPDDKRNQPYYMLAMTAADPQTANDLLQNYIKTINDKVISQDDSEFRNALAAMIQSRQKEQQDIEFSLNAERNNHLAALEQALRTAQGAGIKDYYASSTGQGSTKIELANSVHRYMLGENYLNAEIRSLKNSPTVYPVRYHEIERELTMLEPLLQQQVSAQAYRYQLSPGEYVKKEQPKKALILVLGAMLGMMAGIGWVLVTAQIKQYQLKIQNQSQ